MSLIDDIIGAFGTISGGIIDPLLDILGLEDANFWQIAGLVTSVLQFYLYLEAFNEYKDRLEKLAEDRKQKGIKEACAYKALRDKDREFFTAYKNLPEYEECESNIKRSRGAAMAAYSQQLRRTLPTVRGYLPMQKVALANLLGVDAINQTAMKRVQTKIAERSRVDDHILERWQAIVSAPTNTSSTQDYGPVIQSSFKSLEAFGKGANAALFQAGIGLQRIF